MDAQPRRRHHRADYGAYLKFKIHVSTRISIVEDVDETRECLRALVHGSPGFTCVGAHGTAESALKHLAREKPHILLLDLELPGMPGLECLTAVKGIFPELKVLVLTLHQDPDRLFGALKSGAVGYLVKPTSP